MAVIEHGDFYLFLDAIFRPYEDKISRHAISEFLKDFKAYLKEYDSHTELTTYHILREYLRKKAIADVIDDDPYATMIRELYQRVNSMLIGSRIRDARKAKGMSQTALAKHLNKTLRSVQKYETGEVEVSIAQLDIIADILGVSSKYLLGFNDRLVEVKSLEDVLYFIHDLSKKEELRFKIISKHPQFDGEWSTSIVFDATDDTGEHNRDIVSMLTSYRNQVSLMPYVYHPGKVMDDWVRREGPLYRGATLMNRPPEEIYPPDDNAD